MDSKGGRSPKSTGDRNPDGLGRGLRQPHRFAGYDSTLHEKIEEGVKDTRAGRLSFSQLDQRIRTLESGILT